MSQLLVPPLSMSQPRSDPIAAARPSRAEAEEAVRTLIRWAGDDPEREGLLGTPDRVVRSYREFFSGYDDDPVALLQRTFEETDGYDEIVVLKDIRFESHCEHHIAPIIGKVHVAYLPNNRVVGISKLARLVDVYAKRLQIQEKMTAQIANTLDEVLQPKGVGRGHRGGAPVHDDPRRAQARRHDGDEPHARRLPQRPDEPARGAVDDRHAGRRQARQRLTWGRGGNERCDGRDPGAARRFRHGLGKVELGADRLGRRLSRRLRHREPPDPQRRGHQGEFVCHDRRRDGSASAAASSCPVTPMSCRSTGQAWDSDPFRLEAAQRIESLAGFTGAAPPI